MRPACSAADCRTCKSCQQISCTDPDCRKQAQALHGSLRLRTLEQKRNFKCEQCQGRALQCDVCETTDASNFSASMNHHKANQNERTVCNVCQRPPCQVINCETCHHCCKRTADCKNICPPCWQCGSKPCKREAACNFQPTDRRRWPHPKDSLCSGSCTKCLQNYRCDFCEAPPCSKCDTPQTKMQRQRSQMQRKISEDCQHVEKLVKEEFTCYSCRQCVMQRKLPCVACKEKRDEDQFDAESVRKYNKDQNKKLLCNFCEARGCTVRDQTLYRCQTCGADRGRTKFLPKDVDNFQQKGKKTLHCLDCKRRGH